jgi:hypothetical protein
MTRTATEDVMALVDAMVAGAVEPVCDCGIEGYDDAHFAAWAKALRAQDSGERSERGARVLRAPGSLCVAHLQMQEYGWQA